VDGQSFEKVVIFSSVKELKLHVVRQQAGKTFRLRMLGLHETMRAGLVNRPEGTGDYLFMFFHTPVQIRSSGKIQVWPASTLVIWTPKDGHFYGDPSAPWKHSWFHCAGSAVQKILKASRLIVGKPFPVSDPSVLERYLLETVAELNGWRGPDEITLRNIFENYVRAQARQLFDRKEQLAPAPLLDLRAHIENHFTEKLRLPDLARLAAWSVPHLCTEFRRFFGVPIIQYVQQLRMNQAAYLLRDHNRRISEIAVLVGYPDLYTFSKMFKRRFGVSPRHFRHRSMHSQ
jgi:AraC family transcriptional regulator of arabinose operon